MRCRLLASSLVVGACALLTAGSAHAARPATDREAADIATALDLQQECIEVKVSTRDRDWAAVTPLYEEGCSTDEEHVVTLMRAVDRAAGDWEYVVTSDNSRWLRCRDVLAGVPDSVARDLGACGVGFLTGYRNCGWQNFSTGRWQRTPPDGAYLQVHARRMTCAQARRNSGRVRYPGPRHRPTLRGYRCIVLGRRHEFSDVRCTKRGSRATFRYITGA